MWGKVYSVFSKCSLSLQVLKKTVLDVWAANKTSFWETSSWGDSSLCTLLKQGCFWAFHAPKSPKNTSFEKRGRARFPPGPNPKKGVKPEISGLQILNHAGFPPARDSWETSRWVKSSLGTFLKQRCFLAFHAPKSPKTTSFEKRGQGRPIPGSHLTGEGSRIRNVGIQCGTVSKHQHKKKTSQQSRKQTQTRSYNFNHRSFQILLKDVKSTFMYACK